MPRFLLTLCFLLTSACASAQAGEGVYGELSVETPETGPAPLPAAPDTDNDLANRIVDNRIQQANAAWPLQPPSYDPWHGGIEFGVTRFAHTNGTFALIDDQVGASFRPYLGFETPKGLGIRGSVFLATADSVAVRADDSTRFEIQPAAVSLDIDLYRRLQIQDFSLLVGAGAQAVGFGFEFPDGSDNTWSVGGTTVFAEGRQPYYVTKCSEWSVIGGGRVGYLVGEISYSTPAAYDSVGLTSVTGRAFLGMEYRRNLSRGDLLFQIKGETQVWNTNGVGEFGLDTTGFQFGAAW